MVLKTNSGIWWKESQVCQYFCQDNCNLQCKTTLKKKKAWQSNVLLNTRDIIIIIIIFIYLFIYFKQFNPDSHFDSIIFFMVLSFRTF